VSLEDCKEVDGFDDFLPNFVDEKIAVTIAEAEKVIHLADADTNPSKVDLPVLNGLTKTELQKRLKTSKSNAAHAVASQKNAETHGAQRIPGQPQPNPHKEVGHNYIDLWIINKTTLPFIVRRCPCLQISSLILV